MAVDAALVVIGVKLLRHGAGLVELIVFAVGVVPDGKSRDTGGP